jgi:hypothetical protein
MEAVEAQLLGGAAVGRIFRIDIGKFFILSPDVIDSPKITQPTAGIKQLGGHLRPSTTRD